jgi:hypothetical protein
MKKYSSGRKNIEILVHSGDERILMWRKSIRIIVLRIKEY